MTITITITLTITITITIIIIVIIILSITTDIIITITINITITFIVIIIENPIDGIRERLPKFAMAGQLRIFKQIVKRKGNFQSRQGGSSMRPPALIIKCAGY